MDVETAIRVRQTLEEAEEEESNLLFNTSSMTGPRPPRIYFGEPTPIIVDDDDGATKQNLLLQAPKVDKLFFISPPPSPPHGWVMRNEDPPNKEVHPADLADALARLNTTGNSPTTNPSSPPDEYDDDSNDDNLGPSTPASSAAARKQLHQRSMSGSTIIYNPEHHGASGGHNLPAVMVEDTSLAALGLDGLPDSDSDMHSMLGQHTKTARPPLELME